MRSIVRGVSGGVGRWVFFALCVAAVWFFRPTTADANGFRNPPESAAGIALGGARYTLINDASSMAFNPANLMEVKRPSALVSVETVYSQTDFGSPVGGTESDDPWHVLPNIYVAWPFAEENITAGLAITTPYGQGTRWDRSAPFIYSAPYSAEMFVLNVNPTLAARVSDTVSFAVGVDVFRSSMEIKQLIAASAIAPESELCFDVDGWGLGANAGLTWRVAPRHTLALSYRSGVNVDYDGDYSSAAGTLSAGTDIDFPSIVALGYGLQVTDALRIGAEVEWLEFSRFDVLTLDVDNPFVPDTTAPQDWDDTWTAGVGAEWICSQDWLLRAGYLFLESPIPDSTLGTTLPDADKHMLSLGVGWRGAKDAVDVSYMYGIITDRDVVSSGIPVSYEGTSHIAAISYSRQF